MVLGEDGKWATLDARWLYTSAKTIGYLYEAQLRHNLTVALGVEWGQVSNGIADIEHIPAEVLKAFSTRARRDRGADGDPQPALGEGGDDRRARHPPAARQPDPGSTELRAPLVRTSRRDRLRSRTTRATRSAAPSRRRSPIRGAARVEDRLLGAHGLTAHDSIVRPQRRSCDGVVRLPSPPAHRSNASRNSPKHSSTAWRPHRSTGVVPGKGAVIRDAAGPHDLDAAAAGALDDLRAARHRTPRPRHRDTRCSTADRAVCPSDEVLAALRSTPSRLSDEQATGGDLR